MKLSKEEIRKKVRETLIEDGADMDITSSSLEIGDDRARAYILAKESGVICGLEIVKEVFYSLCSDADIKILKKDGDKVFTGDKVMLIEASQKALLSGERTALNFLSHLSGIASKTRIFVDKIAQYPKSGIYDTRKTLPGLRAFEKYAVRCGGGKNHRFNLADQVLIKENHLKAANLSVKEAVLKARKKNPASIIEVETENYSEFIEALEGGADIVMLDNFKEEDMVKACHFAHENYPSVKVEISGGVSLDGLEKIAAAGADRISVGRITNSAPALDFSFLIE